MRRIVIGLVGVIGVAGLAAQQSDPQPTCKMCPGTYIAEVGDRGLHREGGRREPDRSAGARHRHRQGAHRHRRRASRQADRAGAGVGRRARSGQRGLPHHRRLGDAGHQPRHRRHEAAPGDARNRAPVQRSGQQRIVGARTGSTHELKAGDVIVIPAGTGHWFTKIDDHINYLMVRIDPDKVTPLKDEAASKAYLSKPRQP